MRGVMCRFIGMRSEMGKSEENLKGKWKVYIYKIGLHHLSQKQINVSCI
jgi:hypothetical protein